jgi:hypothetical protein
VAGQPIAKPGGPLAIHVLEASRATFAAASLAAFRSAHLFHDEEKVHIGGREGSNVIHEDLFSTFSSILVGFRATPE